MTTIMEAHPKKYNKALNRRLRRFQFTIYDSLFTTSTDRIW